MKKDEFKRYLMKSIDLCFDKLYEMLSPSSRYYDVIITLKMRHQRNNEDILKGIISIESRNLEQNRIQIALIEFVNKLDDSDFNSSEHSKFNKPQFRESEFNHFWKPFFGSKTTIVIGTYYGERFSEWEKSTLIGTGDALALGITMGILNNVGIKEIDITPTYNFTGDRYQNNLILIGGPDANKITREFYDRINSNLKFGNPDVNEITLYDSKDKSMYLPKYDENRKVIGDYGFAFKTKNPYNPDASIIILAGCFGFGTCAAAKLLESTRLMDEINKSGSGDFEALVYSDVINDWVQKPIIVKSYSL